MSRPTECRVIIEREPHSGSYNMALDEALLESALRDECITLRCYRWSEATVSLGYFQDSSAVDPRFEGLPKVRRLSGGGALLHHHEITYSCTVPPSHELAIQPQELYQSIHERIIDVMHEMGIPARMRGERVDERETLFLCFGRGDPRDVVLDGHKVLGSAQRRRRGAVLQHGAILLRRSGFTPEFPGLFDLAQSDTSDDSLMQRVAESAAAVLGQTYSNGAPSGNERTLAWRLQHDRYSQLDWRDSQRPTSCQ